MEETIKDYLDRNDWRVKENASVEYSIGGLILHIASSASSKYWLENIYPEKISNAHRNCDIHIHDLGYLSAYCQGWSIRQILSDGINGVTAKVSSGPAKHLSTAINHIVNFLGIQQLESAGAQAFSSVDTYLAPFIREDNLKYHEVKQEIQSLVFALNTPSRWGSQPPFSNFTFDFIVPEDMAEQPAIVGGTPMEYTYGDCQKEVDMINKSFLEVMLAGDYNGRTHSYPIPTYNITENFDWESENAQLLFKLTGRYGTPYFQNFINSGLNPRDTRSMCCRLRLDVRELHKRGGGLFGANEFTGSVGVVTINLPRIAYKWMHAEGKKTQFVQELRRLMGIAKESLEIKRDFIKEMTERGLYPYTKRYLRNWNNHFSTIGIIGMHEACIMLGLNGITSQEGKKFAEDVMNYMNDVLVEFQKETGNLYNLEATPAEGTSYRLAKHDKEEFGDTIVTSGEDAPYYVNSTGLPSNHYDDIFSSLAHQEELLSKYTGGSVFHTYVGEEIPDWRTVASLVKKIAYGYKIPYFTISPVFSVCVDHGYISGKKEVCPTCGKPTEVFDRIVGYFRNVSNWNDGKLAEFNDRRRAIVTEEQP